MFGQGFYVTVWSVEDKGNYSVVSMSSRKRKQGTEEYWNDFSCPFVHFVGDAHKGAKDLKPKDRIKLGVCGATNRNEKGDDKYTNFCVFSFEPAGNYSAAGNKNEKKTAKAPKKDFKKLVEVDPVEEDDDDELPF